MGALAQIIFNVGSLILLEFVKKVFLKVLLFGALMVLLTLLFSLLSHFLPDYSDAQLSSYIQPIFASPHSSSTSYFLYLFAVKEGFAMVIGAYITRFTIRRLPFIG